MDRLWLAWWALLPAVAFAPWPNLAAFPSGRLSWAAWALAAACLGMADSRPGRTVSFKTGSLILLGLFLIQMATVLPSMIWTDWSLAWETRAAFGASVCSAAIILFGTASALRHSPKVHGYIAKYAFWALTVNLAAHFLTQLTPLRFWYTAQAPGGFFHHLNAWAGACAIAFPILMQAGRLSVAPALAGLVLAGSACAWTAALSSYVIGKLKMGKLASATLSTCAVLISFMLIVRPERFFEMVNIRLRTWLAVSEAILSNPRGIGFGQLSYSAIVRSHSTGQILPHAGSDFLDVILKAGWISAPVLAWIVWRAFSGTKSDGLSLALLTAAILFCVQSSLSVPHVGILAWGAWMAWKIKNNEEVA